MNGIYMAGMGGMRSGNVPQRGKTHDESARMKIRELEHHIARLSLLNQALWELVRDRIKATDADLEQLAREIDLRDGVEDGKISHSAVECPTCGRITTSKHWKCIYCGQEFEKPVMG